MRARPPAALEHGAVPWLLVVALATAGPHAEHLPAWLTLLVAAALLWRTWLWHQQRRMPPRWSLALLVIAAVAAIGWQFGSLFGKDAGVAMLVLFMALKPLEMHSRRDALVVIMLGYFLLLTHYFYSQSIPTGLWLLAACTLLTGALIRLHGGAQPVIAIAREAGLLLLQALPFMLLLYLLFPRVTGPLWGLPQDAHAGLSGLPSQMSPGSISNLTLSGAIAFRSRFAGEIPEQADLYWRGPVFDEYDGVTWRASRQHGQAASAGAGDRGASAPRMTTAASSKPTTSAGCWHSTYATRLPPDSSLAANARSPGSRTAAHPLPFFLQLGARLSRQPHRSAGHPAAGADPAAARSIRARAPSPASGSRDHQRGSPRRLWRCFARRTSTTPCAHRCSVRTPSTNSSSTVGAASASTTRRPSSS
jgi:uncharacterized membrane protein YtjA (UPF0391 family)